MGTEFLIRVAIFFAKTQQSRLASHLTSPLPPAVSHARSSRRRVLCLLVLHTTLRLCVFSNAMPISLATTSLRTAAGAGKKSHQPRIGARGGRVATQVVAANRYVTC